MKANELMIGDWVYMEHNEDGIAPYKELTQWTKEDFGFSDTFIEAHIYPIPLTPEILEKNGFVARYAYSQKKWHIDIYNDFHRKVDDDGDITLNVYSERKMEWRLSIDTDRNERTVVYIRFVHELQHALRLCGIEKEIEL